MTQLIDRHGNPLIGRPQTKREENLARMVQLPTNPITQGLTPRRIAQILEAMRHGDMMGIADAATEMVEKNTQIFSDLNKRRSAVSLLDWNLMPPENPTEQEERDTALLEACLKDEFLAEWMNGMIFNATDAILKGFSAQEITWSNVHYEFEGKTHQLTLPSDIEFIPQRAFRLHPDDKRKLMLNDGSMTGQPLRPHSWIVHRSHSLSGYDSENSLARVLIWPFIFAALPTRDLMEFIEIYAMPTIIGKYPNGATKEEQDTLMRAMVTIGRQARGMMPHSMNIEFEQAVQGGSENYLNVIEWTERSISKAILGGTLTSQTDDGGAYALGEVHDDVRKELRNKDVKDLEPTINRDLIYPLWMMNAKSYRGFARRPKFTFDTNEPEDMASFSQYLPKLVEMGLEISKDWVHEKLHIPRAESKDDILTIPESSNPFEGFAGLSQQLPTNSLAMLGRQLPKKSTLDAEEQILDEYLEEITIEEYNASIDPILEPIIAAINQGGVKEAKELIPEIYADMSSEEMEETLTQAIFFSTVMGMINANNHQSN